MGKQKPHNNTEPISFTAGTLLPDMSFLGSHLFTLHEFCTDMGKFYGRIKRTLFKEVQSTGSPAISFKNEYLKAFGITARQFNAIRMDLQGNIDSALEVQTARTADLGNSIKSARKWLKTKEAKIRKVQADRNLSNSARHDILQPLRFAVHNKKRRLNTLETKLSALKQDKEEGLVRICFGSKALFHKQFELIENGYVFHDEWLKDWQTARDAMFFFVGSHEETGGNQTCTLTADGYLRIRVPNALTKKYGRHVTIPGVRYPYGQEIIDTALIIKQALAHRFLCKDGKWYLHTTVELSCKPKVTRHPRDIGCIAVDVNEKEIAVAETDRFGNYVWSRTYPACVKDLSTEQTEALYGDICKAIIARCVAKGKPLAHERLDFSKKKSALREQGLRYSRMLSQFAYSTFLSTLDRQAFKSGVNVYTDNAAYTSVIGKVNFMGRYGITSHEAAAIVIARRIQQYSEAPIKAACNLPMRAEIKNKKDLKTESSASTNNTSPVPGRKRGEHVWSFWRRLKVGGACDNLNTLYRVRRPSQGSTSCATSSVPIINIPITSAGAVLSDTGCPLDSTALSVTPYIPNHGACEESGRASPTLVGDNTVRSPHL